MAEYPYMIWFPRDFHADTAQLTPLAELAYRRLLEFLWLRGGKLPLDHQALSRLCRCSGREWGKIWAQVEPYLIKNDDGTISQARITADLLEAGVRASSYSARGLAGAQAKHNKNKQGSLLEPHQNSASGLAQPSTYNHNTPQPPKGGHGYANGKGKAHTLTTTPAGPEKLANGHVWVDLSSDAGLAWQAYRKRTTGRGIPRDQAGGWYLPSAWPPSEPSAAAQPGQEDTPAVVDVAQEKTAAGGASKARETAS